MSRGPATFKQSDLTRALKGTKAAGVDVSRIKIAKDGSIEIDTSPATSAKPDEDEGATNWDAAIK